MSILASLATFGLPLWFGYCLLRSMGLRYADDVYGFLGWIHVTGCLGTALYLLLWMLLGMPLTQTTAVPLALTCAWLHWRIQRQDRLSFTARAASADDTPSWQRIGFAMVVVAMIGYAALVMSTASASAVAAGDEIRHWTFKAKMIYAADGLGTDFAELAELATTALRSGDLWQVWERWLDEIWPTLDEGFRNRMQGPDATWSYHLDYPLLNPLLHVWAYTCAGEILHWQNRFLITGFTLAMLLILAGALRSLTRPHPLLGALLLISVFAMFETMNSLRWSLADGMIACGLLLSMDALRRFHRSGDRCWWLLAVVGMTVLAWSKNEGLMYLVCILVGAISIKLWPGRVRLLWLGLPFLLVVYTWISNGKYGFTNDLVSEPAAGGIERLEPLLQYFWREIIAGSWWSETLLGLHSNCQQLAFLGLLLLFPRLALGRHLRMLTGMILVMVAGQFLVYLATPHQLEWHLSQSALRFTWQGMAVIGLWFGMLVNQLLGAPDR